MAELYKKDLVESERAWLAGFIDGEGYDEGFYRDLPQLNKRGPAVS